MYMHECLTKWPGLSRITDEPLRDAVAGVLATAKGGDGSPPEDHLEALLMAVQVLEISVSNAPARRVVSVQEWCGPIADDPETDRDRFCGPLDRDEPEPEQERYHFDQRDHFSDWGRP